MFSHGCFLVALCLQMKNRQNNLENQKLFLIINCSYGLEFMKTERNDNHNHAHIHKKLNNKESSDKKIWNHKVLSKKMLKKKEKKKT